MFQKKKKKNPFLLVLAWRFAALALHHYFLQAGQLCHLWGVRERSFHCAHLNPEVGEVKRRRIAGRLSYAHRVETLPASTSEAWGLNILFIGPPASPFAMKLLPES